MSIGGPARYRSPTVRRIQGLVTALLLAASTLTVAPVAGARAAGEPIVAFGVTSARAFTPDGDGRDDVQVARVPASIGGTNPSGLVVFLDPGHGGDGNGGAEATLSDGTLIRERDLNLDIALKLAAMLRAAGVRVSMSRTADVPANASRTDRNGDHVINLRDDWLARMDAANRVRADVYLAIHNNDIPPSPTIDPFGHGRTEAFYCGSGCTGSAASRALASAVLQAHVDALSPLQTATWQLTIGDPRIDPADRAPTDDAVHFKDATYPPGRHYYYLGPYAPPFRPRALQMPAMLMESLALSDPHELAMLAQPSIRTLLASAYYDGLARFLAGRAFGLRFDPVATPAAARVGHATTVRVRVTNNGNLPLPAGTGLTVGTVKPVAAYDGSGSPGTTIGAGRLTAPLAPGTAEVVAITVRPRRAGDAIWKIDGVLNGRRTSTARVPFLQWRVRVTR